MSNQLVTGQAVGDGDADAARCGLSEPTAGGVSVRPTQSADTHRVVHNMLDHFRADEDDQEPQSRPAGPDPAVETTAAEAHRHPAFTSEGATATAVAPPGFTPLVQRDQPSQQAGFHRAPALLQAQTVAASHGHTSPTAGMVTSPGVASGLQHPGAAGGFRTVVAPYGARSVTGPGVSETGPGMQRTGSGHATVGPPQFTTTGAGTLLPYDLPHIPRSYSQPGSPVISPQPQQQQLLQISSLPYAARQGSPAGLAAPAGQPGHIFQQWQHPQHPQQAPIGHLYPGHYQVLPYGTGPQTAYSPPPPPQQQQQHPYHHPQGQHLRPQLHLLHAAQQQQQQQQQQPVRVYSIPQQLRDECAAITRDLSSSSGGSKAASAQHRVAQLLWVLTQQQLQQSGSLDHLGLATSVPDPPPDKSAFAVTAGYPQDSRTNPTGAAAGPKPHLVAGAPQGTYLATFYSPRCAECDKTYTFGDDKNTCQSLNHPKRQISIYKLAFESQASCIPPGAASKQSFKDPAAPASKRQKTDLWVPHQPLMVGWFVKPQQEQSKQRGRKRGRGVEAEAPREDAAYEGGGQARGEEAVAVAGPGGTGAGREGDRTGEEQQQQPGSGGGGGGSAGGGGAGAGGGGGGGGQGGDGDRQGGGGEGHRGSGNGGGEVGEEGGGGVRGSGGERGSGGGGGAESEGVSCSGAISTCSSSGGAVAGRGGGAGTPTNVTRGGASSGRGAGDGGDDGGDESSGS